MSSTDWEAQGLCAQIGGDEWFPEAGNGTAAKRMCMRCPVRTECLQAALDRDEKWGVYGGLSGRERRALKQVAA